MANREGNGSERLELEREQSGVCVCVWTIRVIPDSLAHRTLRLAIWSVYQPAAVRREPTLPGFSTSHRPGRPGNALCSFFSTHAGGSYKAHISGGNGSCLSGFSLFTSPLVSTSSNFKALQPLKYTLSTFEMFFSQAAFVAVLAAAPMAMAKREPIVQFDYPVGRGAAFETASMEPCGGWVGAGRFPYPLSTYLFTLHRLVLQHLAHSFTFSHSNRERRHVPPLFQGRL